MIIVSLLTDSGRGITINTCISMYSHLNHKSSCALNSEPKRAFWVNPSLLSTNECRPHLSTYITHGAAKVGRGGASSWSIVNHEKAVKREAFYCGFHFLHKAGVLASNNLEVGFLCQSRCYRKFDRSEILSRRSYFQGNFIAERYFFLGNIIAARKFDRLWKISSAKAPSQVVLHVPSIT